MKQAAPPISMDNDAGLTLWAKAFLLACVYVLLMSFSPMSHADLAGGMSTATNQATGFRTALFALLGVLAGVYVLWTAFLAWSGKQQWTEVLYALGKVAITGAGIAAAAWAWTLGTT